MKMRNRGSSETIGLASRLVRLHLGFEFSDAVVARLLHDRHSSTEFLAAEDQELNSDNFIEESFPFMHRMNSVSSSDLHPPGNCVSVAKQSNTHNEVSAKNDY